jgi:hypothetical protein
VSIEVSALKFTENQLLHPASESMLPAIAVDDRRIVLESNRVPVAQDSLCRLPKPILRFALHSKIPEDFMQNRKLRSKTLAILAALVLIACVAAAADTPANVAGTWNFKVTGDAGSADQTIVIKQDGAKITGTFKGPRQSGTIDGTVDGNNIKFHVTARASIDYTGTVDGDSMKGTLSARGKAGDWTATRAK